MTDTKHMRRVAEAALREEEADVGDLPRDENGFLATRANDVFFDTFDPTTVLSLLDEIDSKEAEIDRLRGALRMCVDRFERPHLSPDANVVLERCRAALNPGAQP